MSQTRKTVEDLITEMREDLDEEIDATGDTNFWTDSFLLGRLNRGLRQVWQAARNEKGSPWFVRRMMSTDDKLIIRDQEYDPSLLRLLADREELILPPDFGELKYFEPLTDDDNLEGGLIFRYADIGSDSFRVLSRTEGPDRGGAYSVVILQREKGMVIRIAPVLQISDPRDIDMEYIVIPGDLTLTTQLANLGYDDFLLDAGMSYAMLEATRKEGSAENIARAQANWNDKLTLLKMRVAPHQTVEPEVARGYLEEDT